MELETTAAMIGAKISDVRCDGAGGDVWTCNAFNSVSSEQTYKVRYADGEWSFENAGG